MADPVSRDQRMRHFSALVGGIVVLAGASAQTKSQ